MTEAEKLILEQLNRLSEDIKELKTENLRTQLLIENDISKKIDIIGEGHDFLKQRLNDAYSIEQKRESMELQLINHNIEIQKIKKHLGIA